MAKIFYELTKKVNIERYRDGATITIENSDNIICLGNYECDLMDIACNHEFKEAIHILSEKYCGAEIEREFEAFCSSLCEHGILNQKIL